MPVWYRWRPSDNQVGDRNKFLDNMRELGRERESLRIFFGERESSFFNRRKTLFIGGEALDTIKKANLPEGSAIMSIEMYGLSRGDML